jgi:hypothetical protein
MKRPVVTALFLCAVAALAGCPIYDHEDNGCFHSSDCAQGYSCDRGSGECILSSGDNGCSKPSDCGVNETCSKAAECVSGDCSFSGCVSGYTCDSSSGTWACVLTSSIGGGAGAANEGGAAGAASLPMAGAGGAPTGSGDSSGAAGQAGAR